MDGMVCTPDLDTLLPDVVSEDLTSSEVPPPPPLPLLPPASVGDVIISPPSLLSSTSSDVSVLTEPPSPDDYPLSPHEKGLQLEVEQQIQFGQLNNAIKEVVSSSPTHVDGPEEESDGDSSLSDLEEGVHIKEGDTPSSKEELLASDDDDEEEFDGGAMGSNMSKNHINPLRGESENRADGNIPIEHQKPDSAEDELAEVSSLLQSGKSLGRDDTERIREIMRRSIANIKSQQARGSYRHSTGSFADKPSAKALIDNSERSVTIRGLDPIGIDESRSTIKRYGSSERPLRLNELNQLRGFGGPSGLSPRREASGGGGRNSESIFDFEGMTVQRSRGSSHAADFNKLVNLTYLPQSQTEYRKSLHEQRSKRNAIASDLTSTNTISMRSGTSVADDVKRETIYELNDENDDVVAINKSLNDDDFDHRGLESLLAEKVKMAADEFRTEHPLKTTCLTWNCNARTVSAEEMANWLFQNLTVSDHNNVTKADMSVLDDNISLGLNNETKKEIAIHELDEMLKKDKFSRQDTIRMQALVRESAGKPKGMYESLGGLLQVDMLDTPDIVVIGLQEIVELSAVGVVVDSIGDFGSKDTTKEWVGIASAALSLLSTRLAKQDSSNAPIYSFVTEVHMVGIALLVFVRAPLMKHVTNVQKATVATGKEVGGSRLGNKGGVTIRMQVYDTSMCFVSAHLAANTKYWYKRNENVQDIFAAKPFVAISPNELLENEMTRNEFIIASMKAMTSSTTAPTPAASTPASTSTSFGSSPSSSRKMTKKITHVENDWKVRSSRAGIDDEEDDDDDDETTPAASSISTPSTSAKPRKKNLLMSMGKASLKAVGMKKPNPNKHRDQFTGTVGASPSTQQAPEDRTESEAAEATDFVSELDINLTGGFASDVSGGKQRSSTYSRLRQGDSLNSENNSKKSRQRGNSSANTGDSSGNGSNSGNNSDDEEALLLAFDSRNAEKILRKRLDQNEKNLGMFGVLDHDVVFFLGDLNYRIDDSDLGFSYDKCHELINTNKTDVLLNRGDQLLEQRKIGNVFEGFVEAKIDFPPTYKFVPGTDVFDRRPNKKKRAPAFCDRILWKLNEASEKVGLVSLHTPQCADLHTNKPIFDDKRSGVFPNLKYRPVACSCPSDHVPLAASFVLMASEKRKDNFSRTATRCFEEVLGATSRFRLSMERRATTEGRSVLNSALNGSSDEEEEIKGGLAALHLEKYNNHHSTFTLPYRFGFTPPSLYEVVEKLDESTVIPDWVVKLSDKRHNVFNKNSASSHGANKHDKLVVPSALSNGRGNEDAPTCHESFGLAKFVVETQSIPSWIEVTPLEGYLPLGGEVELVIKVQPITEVCFDQHSVGKHIRAVVVVRILEKVVPLPISISYEAPLKLVISPPAPINIRNSWVTGYRRTSHASTASSSHVSGPVSIDLEQDPPSPSSDGGPEPLNYRASESSRNMMYFNPGAKATLNSRRGSGGSASGNKSSNPRVPLAAESTVEISEATVL